MKKFVSVLIALVVFALIIGGIYYWQQLEKDPVVVDHELEEEEPVEEEEDPVEEEDPIEVNVYEDAFLSFEYPENVELSFESPMGGRPDSQGIEFLSYDEDRGTYVSTGLRLSYIVSLGEDEDSAFDSPEALLANYEGFGLETEKFSVDERTAVRVMTGDMTGETFFLVIPSEEAGDAYRFNGAYQSDEVEEILEMFMRTAELYM